MGSLQILSLDVFYNHIANGPVSLVADISCLPSLHSSTEEPMRRKMTLQKLLLSGGMLELPDLIVRPSLLSCHTDLGTQ